MSPPPETGNGEGDPVFTVARRGPLVGRITVPGDKSLSHRALLLGALSAGESVVRGLSDGADVVHTATAFRALGARVDAHDGSSTTVVSGGPAGLRPPAGPLDMGNSGTTIRLLAGVVAGHDFTTQLVGDRSLSTRPMDRVAAPLRLMGAVVDGVGARCTPPLTIRGGVLRGIDYTTPMASAQVKSCVLLAGLGAEGDTVVREPVLTRRHTEELLARCGVLVTETEESDGTHVVRLVPSRLAPFELDVPGDPSQAAFWVVAACIVPGSAVTVGRVYVGAGRRGYLDVLARMGADLSEVPATGPGDLAATADIVARHGALRGTEVLAAEITGLDEVPVLAVAAACASGDTVFRDVGELRVKESDRLTGVADLVGAFGGRAEVDGDDLWVSGTGALAPGTVDAGGDHRMAMAAAVAALAAGGAASTVAGWGAVATSYPGFAADLARLDGSRVSAGPATGGTGAVRVVAIDGPAGAGKSTLAQAVAERLGVERLDTGAMYRAVAWAALSRGVDVVDVEGVADLARGLRIEVGRRVVVDGEDATDAIRTVAVDAAVSAVAANPAVRRELVARQRAWVAARGRGVVEGRDIGTVVLPDADVKIYLTAATEARAERRARQRDDGRSVAAVHDDLVRRDRLDSTRLASPLPSPEDVAADAKVIDSTGKSSQAVLEEVLACL